VRIQESRASLGEIWKSRASLWGNTGGQLWDLGRFRCGSHGADEGGPALTEAPDTISHNVYYVTKRSTHTNPNQSSPGRTLLPFKQPSQRPQNLAPRRQLLTQHAGPPV